MFENKLKINGLESSIEILFESVKKNKSFSFDLSSLLLLLLLFLLLLLLLNIIFADSNF